MKKGNIFFRLWRIPFRLALGEGLVIAESLIGIHWSGSRTEIQPRVRCMSYDISGNNMKIISLSQLFPFTPSLCTRRERDLGRVWQKSFPIMTIIADGR